MPTNITIIDEAIIDASPDVVFNAVMDEFAGVSHWWMPLFEIKPRPGTPERKIGMVSDVTVHDTGTPRFVWTVTDIVLGSTIDVKYDGDFSGTGEWVFEPCDGKTRVKYIWSGRP